MMIIGIIILILIMNNKFIANILLVSKVLWLVHGNPVQERVLCLGRGWKICICPGYMSSKMRPPV